MLAKEERLPHVRKWGISLLILASRITALLKVIVSSRQFLGGNMLENL